MTMCDNEKIERLENTVKALEIIMNNMEDFIIELQMASCMNAARDPDHCITVKIEDCEGDEEECAVCKKTINKGDTMNRAYYIGGRTAPMHDVCFGREWEKHFDLPYL